MSFNDLADRIEYKGVQLVNANQLGHCSRCENPTFWYDPLISKFLCSEECVEQAYLDLFNHKINRNR